MYLVRTPDVLRPLARDLLWRVRTDEKVVHLTFDDGPVPEVTPWVLDRLKEHDAKATFFCIGRNVERDPALFQRIMAEGHAVGNHTWAHANGWRTSHRAYCRSVLQCDRLVRSRLFRPPYGRITRSQVGTLKRRFQPVMWDVLSADFDPRITAGTCISNVLDNVRPGSIIVFHDSVKAWPRLEKALPAVLRGLREMGYSCAALEGGTTAPPDEDQAPIPPARS